MRNSNFSVLPPLGVGVFGKLPAARKRKDRQRNRLGRSERAACPRTESPLEIWLGRSNRSRAGLAGPWTTRVQARRGPADPTGDRKPKACHRPNSLAPTCAMLVQAQVVPWWGTGRLAEFSPSGFHLSRASPTGRRIGG